ncbi:TerB family tellurite resistance protein [Flavobacterium sp. N3904]|uniref:tellurite resistance TerB family protein n=1 Tax=Flavobacterium sp. N3904 TaxID=2986835 RepID=UPI0022257F12|nr:TerB family tellurite resistance protein [Flavobacterium sp. N3904]
MPFSDLFSSEFNQANKGNFSAIVRVAYAGGNITEQEQKFLDKLAVDLEISEEEYKEILEDPNKYPINAPYLYIERLESLYKIARIVRRDHQLGDKQEHLMIKFALALGFTPGNVNYIVDKALKLVDKHVDLDTFIYEMKNMYK